MRLLPLDGLGNEASVRRGHKTKTIILVATPVIWISTLSIIIVQSYWAKDIPYETVQRAVENSLCFGVFHQQKQIGFARVITDQATFDTLLMSTY